MSSTELDAVIVGSGPNGLAAAIVLARAGLRVRVYEAMGMPGGGARSTELTLPGFVHDLGSAIHPLAAGSPFFRSLRLEKHGLEWIYPDLPLAHPLPDGQPAATLMRSVGATARALGKDADGYFEYMHPLVTRWQRVTAEILQPLLHVPRYPLTLAGFGLRGIWPAETVNRHYFKAEPARALFAGLAAHSFLPLSAPGSSAFAAVLGMMGHAVDWPLPRGGAQAITTALIGCLRDFGGEIECNAPVRSLADLPSAKARLFDVSPPQFLKIAGDLMPAHYRDALTDFQPGPGIFKVDYALDGPVPWSDAACHRAGTIHVCGSAAEVAESERAVARGRIPDRPFVLVAQPSLFDQTRAPEGRHTLWAYCHIPHGSIFDMTSRIEAQIERFAPGFRDRVLARHTMGPEKLEASNPNLAGGDISGGATNLRQLIARPIASTVPYRTPLRGVYLCSASTPPGGGVHGMCGFYAGLAALADVFA